MRKILIPVDGSISSQFAATHALDRLRAGEALSLHLLTVQYKPHAHLGLANVVSPNMIEAYVTELGQAALDPVIAVLKEAGAAFETEIAFGDPARTIVDQAATGAYAEIIMGTRGTSILAGIFVGSVATKVVSLVNLPVTLVPTPTLTMHRTGQATPANAAIHVDESIRRTLIPIDGSEHALRAVDHVIAHAARGAQGEFVLLNVQAPYPNAIARHAVSPDALASAQQAEGMNQLGAAHAKLLAAGLPVSQRVVIGEPAETIANTAADLGCSRVVMGTRGSGALAQFFFGSTAKRVLHLINLPVTLLK